MTHEFNPSAIVLLEAVSDVLRDDLLPELHDSRLKFRLRIAMNALSIVTRELATEDSIKPIDGAAQITDTREAHLAAIRARLSINNPAFLEGFEPQPWSTPRK